MTRCVAFSWFADYLSFFKDEDFCQMAIVKLSVTRCCDSSDIFMTFEFSSHAHMLGLSTDRQKLVYNVYKAYRA